MQHSNYISEHDAASSTGVSISTLQRFSEAGYLRVEVSNKGERFFARSELFEVFGIKPESVTAPEASSETASDAKVAETKREEVVTPVIVRPNVTEQINRASEPELMEDDAEPAPVEPVKVSPPPVSERVEARVTSATTELTDQKIAFLSEQVTKLNNVVAIQEKILDMREAELRDLKDQRDWLRQRVEKLEEKSDRDQLLLLSETQVIRRLVGNHEAKRSPVRLALEWLGVMNPPAQQQSQSATIEVTSGKSDSEDRRSVMQ